MLRSFPLLVIRPAVPHVVLLAIDPRNRIVVSSYCIYLVDSHVLHHLYMRALLEVHSMYQVCLIHPLSDNQNWLVVKVMRRRN